MQEYNWSAIHTNDGTPAYGRVFAENQTEAFVKVNNCGFYTDIRLEEVAERNKLRVQ